MSSAQIKTLEDFIQLQNRNALSHAIRASVELGVFGALAAGQKTTQQLASELDLQPEPLARMMKVLVETELVEQYGDDYALSTIARLIPEPFLDFGDEYWKHLAQHVRTGVSLANYEALPHQDNDYFINKASEEWTLTPAALDAAQVLDVGKSRRGLRILEVGCGSAVFGVTLVHRDPDSVLNLLDDAAGLERARKTVASLNLERQVEFIESDNWLDLTAVPELQGQTFDLILLAGILHRLSHDASKSLLHQLHELIKPDRELVIIDVFPGQQSGETQRAVFELELGLRTTSGCLHDPEQLKALLQEAGFHNIQYAHLPSAPNYLGLTLAERS
jgi:cyclopropane fatty-acyl-phospholipid synthase-like methyltransferase